MVDQSDELSRRIQEVVDEERRQAADDRQQLMAQIGALITAQAETQEGRLAEKAALLQKGLRDAGSTLGSSVERYDESMDVWDSKEEKLLEDVKESRDTLKTRLQDDWNVSIPPDFGSVWAYLVANEQQVANEHSSSIQATTKSVHAQTVRIVDEQISDLGAQMQALDDFVSRARTENAQHHGSQVAAVEDVSLTVEGSYDAVGSHFRTAFDRVKGLGTDMDAETEAARGGLEPIEEDVCGPLAGLRGDVGARALREYEPTGETPQKVTYRYPTQLPHTASHEVLLAGMNAPDVSPSKRSPMPPVFEDDARSPMGSPAMGSDGALSPVARDDETMDDTPVKQSSEERNPTEEPTETEVKIEPEEAPADEEEEHTPRGRGMSLREINPNLTTSFAFDTAASIASPENATLPMLKKSVKKGIPRKGPVGRENMVPDMPKRKSPRLN